MVMMTMAMAGTIVMVAAAMKILAMAITLPMATTVKMTTMAMTMASRTSFLKQAAERSPAATEESNRGELR
eukprot:6191025-Alexandrium_andersonii.AAC.2